jgi:hypothetical protein
MREKQITQSVQRDASGYKLPRCSGAAVDHIRYAIDQEQGGRVVTATPNPWTALRAKKDESRALPFLRQDQRSSSAAGKHKTRGTSQKLSATIAHGYLLDSKTLPVWAGTPNVVVSGVPLQTPIVARRFRHVRSTYI